MFAEPIKFPFNEKEIRKTLEELVSVDQALAEHYRNDLIKEYDDDGEEPLGYLIIADISRHLVSRLRQHDIAFFRAFFQKVEYILNNSDPFMEELMVIGFFESLQSESSQFNYKYYTFFDQWLGENSKKEWRQLIDFWEGTGWRLKYL
jgi:hypothetical protein